MARLDWTKPVASLLHTLQTSGFTIQAVNDGQEICKFDHLNSVKARKEAVDAVTSVDESYVRIHDANQYGATLFIVLGNEPDELVADWSHQPKFEQVRLENAIDAYINRWQGKKCPKVAN
jgi:hypothetical protein